MFQTIAKIPEESFKKILDILPEPWFIVARVYYANVKVEPKNLRKGLKFWNNGNIEIRLENGTKEDILNLSKDGNEFSSNKEQHPYAIFKEAKFKHGSLNIDLTSWEIVISHNKAVEENLKEVIEFFLKINSIPDIKFMWSK